MKPTTETTLTGAGLEACGTAGREALRYLGGRKTWPAGGGRKIRGRGGG